MVPIVWDITLLFGYGTYILGSNTVVWLWYLYYGI